MRRTQLLAASWLLSSLIGLAAALPSAASAQDDLTGIVPYIMLVVDTSGSMERLSECTCTTPSCNECLPQCGSSDPAKRKNRWALTLEALTGEFDNFQCEPLERSVENGMTYDQNYVIPYHQPWRCPTAGTACPFNTLPAPYSQQSNGILDLNISGIRFGLMTFDGIASYGRDDQHSLTEFDDSRSEGIEGMWSYAGKKVYRYPGCPHEYVMDTGSRSGRALEGALISISSCTGGGVPGSPGCESWCTSCSGDQANINKDIQESLLASRPFGGTPIAAALDDLYYHFTEDLTDAFAACRNRFGILITDGRPDDDYRNVNCGCNEPGNSCDGLLGPTEDPADMKCPYPKPEQVALDLVEGRGSDSAPLKRLYVLGLAVEGDDKAREAVEKMARNGCTETDEECMIEGTDPPSPAIFADDLNTLRVAVQAIVDDQNHAVSRTLPAYALSDDRTVPQYMFTSGLRLPTQANQPWHGILERHRFVCSAGGSGGTTPSSAQRVDLVTEDRFHDTLNTQTNRRLITAMPFSGSPGMREGNLTGRPGACDPECGILDLTNMQGSELRPLLETATDSEAINVRNWMLASSGTPRDDAALGAIYHSTPAVASAPRYDTSDAGYNQWRRRPEIANRPQVVYVATTDGLLHAISTGRFANSAGGQTGWRSLNPGEELWAFVPPMLLNDLKVNLTTQQFLMDGTPTIRTVNLKRNVANGTDDFRTILTMGMREGGSAYIALDITDPFAPKFLWQIAGGTLGKTYASPALTQARYTDQTGTEVNGAIAILPGGMGRRSSGGDSCDGGSTKSYRNPGGVPFASKFAQPAGNPATAYHRSDVKCWEHYGRSLAFVEAGTGVLLKEIYMPTSTRTSWQVPPPSVTTSEKPIFPSPLVSAPSAFPDEIGTPASRVFITDADGVIWRIDISAANQRNGSPDDGWIARPFHDIFFDRSFGDGELSYEAPLLSVDGEGRPVVIVGTGDTSNFYKPAVRNRIVSVTEALSGPVTTPAYEALVNWEMRVRSTDRIVSTKHTDGTNVTVDGLGQSELVTGAMGLFEGQLFVGTFIAAVDTGDVCDDGRGRLLALHYNKADYNDENDGTVNTYGPMRINAGNPNPSQSIVNLLRSDIRGDTVKVSGITLVQVPSCADTQASFPDPWSDSWTGVSSLTPPDVRMIAHADDDNSDPTDTVQQRGGSALSTVEQQLNPPVRLSRVLSWAATAD